MNAQANLSYWCREKKIEGLLLDRRDSSPARRNEERVGAGVVVF